MIIIVESGSTKADWVLVDDNGTVIHQGFTQGLNPTTLSSDNLHDVIKEELDRNFIDCPEIESLFFYGAGCGSNDVNNKLERVIANSLQNVRQINVYTDLMAAVHGVSDGPAVVGILGTGSNTCYFNGSALVQHRPSLGYLFMDEGSGNHLGRKLLSLYYSKLLSVETMKKLEQKFDLTADVVRRSIFDVKNPNKYLATFAKFILVNQSIDELYNIIRDSVDEYFIYQISMYRVELKEVPLHLVGSVAYFASDIIRDIAEEWDIKVGNIVRSPLDGLIQHHLSN